MAEAPAMPLWTDAYLADTGHLTTIEHGAYLLLLMTMWRAGGALPNDDKRLARFARLTMGQWRRMKPTLMEFFDVSSDEIRQSRLTAEFEFVRRKRKSHNSHSPSKSLKNNKVGSEKEDVSRAGARVLPTPTPINKKKVSKDTSKKEPDPVEIAFEEFWVTYPRRPCDSKKAAKEKYRAAVRRGVAPTTINAGAQRYAASRQGEDPQYTKQAKAWLHQECWDAPEVPAFVPLQRGQPSQRTKEPTAAEVAAMFAGEMRNQGNGQSEFENSGPACNASCGFPGDETGPTIDGEVIPDGASKLRVVGR